MGYLDTAPQSRTEAPDQWLKGRVYTFLALVVAAGATYFFATAGPIDPLRDVFFSLAVSLDLLSIFLTWRAVSHVVPAWLAPYALQKVQVIRNPASRVTLLVRTPVPSPVQVLWGNSAWRYVLLLLAITLYGTSIGLFLYEASLAYVYVTWLGGIVTLLVAYIPGERPRWRLGRWEWIAVVGLLVIGGGMRAYQLGLLPLRVHGDMASVGLQARAILRGEFPGWFSLGWATIPMWGFAHEAFTMALLGDSLIGLRASAVLGGMVSLLGVYALGRETWSPRVGVLALAALAIDVVHIHFSRIPSYIDPVPWMVWGLFFLVRGYRRRSPFHWALAGVCAAVAGNMYFSGRLIVPILLLFVIYIWLFHPRGWRANREGIVVLGLAFLVALGPMAITIVREWPAYTSRFRFVSLWDPGVYQHLIAKYQVTTFREVILEQLQRTFLTYQYFGDTSTQFGFPYPMLHPWLVPFFLIGVGVASGRLRHQGNFLLGVWLLLGLVLGSMLTVDAPFWPRLVVITPANALAIGVGMVWVWDVLGGRQGWERRLLALSLVIVIAWAGWQNWYRYRPEMSAVAGENDFAARFMVTVRERVPCFVTGTRSLDEREFAFLLAEREVIALRPSQWEQDIQACVQRRGVVVALAVDRPRVEIIRQQFPGGRWEEIQGPRGTPTLIVYWLPE